MRDEEGKPLLSALLLLGSFTFGYNLHTFLHELGHAISIWVQGGTVHGFILHPFLASYAPSTYVPDHVLLYLGGALIGGTGTVLFAFLAWRYRSPYLMPLVMACAAGLLTTSRWMFVAPFTDVFTDYHSLITLGAPPVVIFLWGLLFLVVGLTVFILYLPLVGISHRSSLVKHLIVIELGILPYQVGARLYCILTADADLQGAVSRVMYQAVALAILACLSKWLSGRIPFLRSVEMAPIRKTHAVVVWAVAAAFIIGMLLVSIPRDMVVT
ncbi:MAG: hypothetical protein JSV52_10980 [Candidatus Zixiibacteriota bacterium]|nr:MAG: hypothetical protein JSV52_10980 [candidate division Zixibacteria bacterium]